MSCKKTLLTFLSAFIALHLSAQTDNSYFIEGNVKGMNTKKVFLTTMKKLSDKNYYIAVIDSSEVTKDRFVFQKDTSMLEPSWSSAIYYIDTVAGAKIPFSFKITENKSSETFTLDWGKTQVKGKAQNGGIEIIGSKEADFLSQYNQLLSHDEFYYASMAKLDSLRKTRDTTSYYRTKILTDSLDQVFKSQLAGAIVSNPTSWLALVNAYQNAKKFDYLQLKVFENDFGPQLLATPTGQKFTEFINGYQSVQVGSKFPTFAYKNQNRKLTKLDDIKGKNGTLVIFWASWCGPCRAEIPYLKSLYEKYHSKGINFVSISTDDNLAKWTQALTKEKMPWFNLANLSDKGQEINSKYKISAVPSMFLLDDHNKIIVADEYRNQPLQLGLEKLSRYAN